MKLKYKLLSKSLIITAIFSLMFLSIQSVKAIPPKMHLVPSDYSNGITWNKAQKINKPIVINFYVDWCHFCQGFAPILDKLRQQYSSKYSFVFINCDDPQNQELVNNFQIQSYPSLFIIDKKKHKKVQVDNYKYQNINLLTKEFDKFLK